MFNPLVFKRITKSWLVDKLLPLMHQFYNDLEYHFSCKLLFHKDIIKLITREELNEWLIKYKSNQFSSYIYDVSQDKLFNGLKEFAGYVQIKNS